VAFHLPLLARLLMEKSGVTEKESETKIRRKRRKEKGNGSRRFH